MKVPEIEGDAKPLSFASILKKKSPTRTDKMPKKPLTFRPAEGDTKAAANSVPEPPKKVKKKDPITFDLSLALTVSFKIVVLLQLVTF